MRARSTFGILPGVRVSKATGFCSPFKPRPGDSLIAHGGPAMHQLAAHLLCLGPVGRAPGDAAGPRFVYVSYLSIYIYIYNICISIQCIYAYVYVRIYVYVYVYICMYSCVYMYIHSASSALNPSSSTDSRSYDSAISASFFLR